MSLSQLPSRRRLRHGNPRGSKSQTCRDDNSWDDLCCVCQEGGGSLYLCGKCVHAYHRDCLGASGKAIVDDVDSYFDCSRSGCPGFNSCTARTDPARDDGTDEESEVDDDEDKCIDMKVSMHTAIGHRVGVRRGAVRYKRAVLGNWTIEVGTVVSVRKNAVPDVFRELAPTVPMPYLALVEDVFEDYDEDCRTKRVAMLRILFYVHPYQTVGRTRIRLDNEVYLTHTAYDLAIEGNVIGVATVINCPTEGDVQRFLKIDKEKNNDAFLCRSSYNEEKGSFHPLPLPKGAYRGARKPVSNTAMRDSDDGDIVQGLNEVEASAALLNPVLQRKERKLIQPFADPDDAFREAIALLQLSAVPKKLPCREKERREVESFLANALRSKGVGAGLYIAGVPGTGKTATVRRVIHALKKRASSPHFAYLELNALRLQTPKHAYSEVWRKLTGQAASPGTALTRIEEMFRKSSSKHDTLVLVLDEFDFLFTRSQSVIYNLFNWPTLPHARLIVIGIANTLDLLDRLSHRVRSRLGFTRVDFFAYNRNQIAEIIASRLRSTQIFDDEAIELGARKVAAISGDIRRALRICIRAAEIAQSRYAIASEASSKTDSFITLSDVSASAKELSDSMDIRFVQALPLQLRVLICCVTSVSQALEIVDVPFDKIASRHETICHRRNLWIPSIGQMVDMVRRLDDLGLIAVNCPKDDVHITARLLMLPDDVAHALRDDPVTCGLLSV